MSTTTSHLNLEKLGNGEAVDTWDGPINANFQKIDDATKAMSDEIEASRGSTASLPLFLGVGHESNGSLKAQPEVISARNSTVYGDKSVAGQDFTLTDRLEAGDTDVFDAKESEDTLRDALATKSMLSMIVSGGANGLGYPSWMSFSGPKVRVDGSVTALRMLIEGYLARVRTLEEITLSGPAGTYHVYASFAPNGLMRVNGDPSELGPPTPPLTSAGVSSLISGEDVPRLFTDITRDFMTLDVQEKDILYINSGANKGKYVIKELAPLADNSQLKIVGHFKGVVSAQSYTIFDPLAPVLGFDATYTPAPGKFYIGEADFDGTAVTAIRPRHFKNEFIGDWRAVDVGTITTFEEIWQHGLGGTELDIVFQASTANDGSAPVETLSEATLSSTLGFTGNIGSLAVQNNGPTVVQPTLTAGSQSIATPVGVSYSAGLTGIPGGTVTGAVVPNRSIRAKYDRNKIWVKNAVAGKFFKDYDDTERTQGYIRVLIRKRG